jgi:hypothetical protein
MLFTLLEATGRTVMTNVHYRLVEREGGWTYKAGDVFSERFALYDEVRDAAERAAAEQRLPGSAQDIEYQDEAGDWHEEVSQGSNPLRADVTE